MSSGIQLSHAPVGHTGERRVEPEDIISDWYIYESQIAMSYVYPGPIPVTQSARLAQGAEELLRLCIERTKSGYDEFVVRYNNRSYRGHRITSIGGAVYALRKMPDYIPSLKDLGLQKEIQAVLMDKHLLKGGLVMICGETGQGKSTTCAATVKERMLMHGSFCLTVEDPPEMPLHGVHKLGRCVQTEVQSGNFAEAMKGAMRCFPSTGGSMLYVGETRDPETAANVLQNGINGHLVFTTVHSSDVISGIKRMISLAKQVIGDYDETKSVLASCLRVVMHQRLETKKGIGGQADRREIKAKFLMSASSSSPIANKIRGGTEEQLASDVQQQEMILTSRGTQGLLEIWKPD